MEDHKPTIDDEEYIADSILETEEMKKIFVGNVNPETEDEELKTFFETMSGGKVTDHVLIRKEGKKSNFGFVTFETSELIDEVLLKRSQLKLNNRDLEVNRAVPKNNNATGAHEKSKKLFIANLPKTDCNEDELRKYFEQRHPKKYGTIESVQLIKKKDDQGNLTEENKGFGFVMVSSEDLADKMAIQHATFNFGGRKIELKKSVPTNEGGGRGRGGRGRGRGGRGGMSQGGSAYGQYGGGYGGRYGGGWGDSYGYGGGYDYSGGYGGYGGGYSASSRGGGGRFQPY